jgi:hypothetical protein
MSLTIQNLTERREQRTRARNAKHALARAHAARDERNAIIAGLRALPLKKLRAIAKAAQQVFKSNVQGDGSPDEKSQSTR